MNFSIKLALCFKISEKSQYNEYGHNSEIDARGVEEEGE